MKTKLLIIFSLAQAINVHAGSASWNLNPVSGNWNFASNWTPAEIPNGTADIATFDLSNTTSISIINSEVEVAEIVFNPGASAFTINTGFHVMTISGAGISNNSGVTQNFVIPPADETFAFTSIFFTNEASAGELTRYTLENADGEFIAGGKLEFFDTARAGAATIIATGGGLSDFSTLVEFFDEATADYSTITNEAGESGSVTSFLDNATAGNSLITAEGGSMSGSFSGFVGFSGSANGGASTIINEGATAAGASGGETIFSGTTHASNATLIANTGTEGGEGGLIQFWQSSRGGGAVLKVYGNGALDVGAHDPGEVGIGSLEGDGMVFLGSRNLTVGTSNTRTVFSGMIQDGGVIQDAGGSLTKIGSGNLTLTGANTYTGGTTVSQGTLVVSNQTGSGTGTAAVSVNGGTLGGNGIIAGAVTIDTGSGAGSFLVPAAGTHEQATLTLQSALALNSDATYTYTFKARDSQTRTDLLIANGLTIDGAKIKLKGKTQGTLTPGTVLTVISNTSANPINGTFSNLSDGAIVNVNGNNLQASYSGGDGNDLTLTVVP